jgi:flagellar hook-associated protein 1 FlgK
MDARTHAALENLSQYIDFTATEQPNHTVTVLLNGQVPLLIEDQQYSLSFGLQKPDASTSAFPNAPPLAYVRSAAGTDITGQITDGQLGALLGFRNQTLTTYIGDSSQAGDLNRMAKAFADRVNGILTTGQVSAGPPPVTGSALFVYNALDGSNVAATLQVDPAVTPDQLGAIAPGPPSVSNGTALAISAMASPTQDADKIDGVSFTEFYGRLASDAGSGLQDARNGQQVQQSLVAQAKDLRQQLSGISLDEEATLLIQFQRGYQAVSKFITVLDQLTQEVIGILK